MTKRPTNQELAADFRKLLTDGFYCVNENGDRFFDSAMVQKLAETKPWRNELWQAFREIEDRLDPIGAMDRERQKKNT